MTSFKFNYFIKALSPNTITLGVRVSTYGFWGDTIQPIALPMLKMRFLEAL